MSNKKQSLQSRRGQLSSTKQALLAKRLAKVADNPNAIPKRPEQNLYPLSFAQERLWFLTQLEPESPAYNRPLALRISGLLDRAAIETALNKIITRHEVLRTTIRVVEGRPIQHLQAMPPIRLPIIDLRSVSLDVRNEEALHHISAELSQPFDLSKSLIRATLLQLDNAEHILLLIVHHIAFDAWSAKLFIQELIAFYQNSSNDAVDEQVPDLPIQIADFAHWQREMLKRGELDPQFTYWRKQLGGELPILNLPTDYARPANPTDKGASESFALDQSLTEALKSQCQQMGVTSFMLLVTAFKVFLFRITGQTDILIGTPINNRNHVELEKLIGFVVNTLVLRTDLSGDLTWEQLVERVNKVALNAYANQDVPFEKLVAELEPAQSPNHHPLFQVVFTLHRHEEEESWRLPDITFSQLPVPLEAAKFDLRMRMVESGGQFTGTVSYKTELFSPATVQRMIEQFTILLKGIIADPSLPISQLPLLSQTQRQRLLVEWNATQVDFPLTQTFTQLFEEQVERTPHASAAFFGPQTLTYQELNQRANRLAHLLVAEGVDAGVLVAVLARRNLDFLPAILAILKAGGAYLPLDPRQPASRHAQVLSQSQSTLVLISDEFEQETTNIFADMPVTQHPKCLSLEQSLNHLQIDTNLPLRNAPHDLAYVIYTSGSTGMPKGAMVEQRGMINHLYAKISDLRLTEADVVAQTASQSFDISVWQFLAALLVGGRVHILDDETALNPQRLLEEVDAQKITILETVPSLLKAMLVDRSQMGGLDLETLRWLIPTGEALPPDLANRWLGQYPNIPLLNAYGPTECSDDVTHFVIEQPLSPQIIHTPIGRPIANMQVYVLDQTMQPMPIGMPGDLWIGGVGVGRGYLHDPDLTKKMFVDDPFLPQKTGARLYKTGDLARFLPDGNLEFLGRIDHQVKVRGFRIELREIEVNLQQHPRVHECVVVALENKQREKQLVAYIVPIDQQAPSVEILRSFLAKRLPDYMIPALFVMLDELPLTPNGKIDRKTLPAPDQSHSEAKGTFVAPQSPLQCLLAEKWQTILEIEAIGIHDNFFALGGSSIQGAILINQLQLTLSEVIYVVALFDAPTIASLAEYLQQHYPKAVAKINREELAQGDIHAQSTVNQERLAAFQRLIPPLLPKESQHQKNSPAIFVLSAPRSGSTLFRVMLGGHSQLFAPPELDLLSFNTLTQRQQALGGRFNFRLEGLLRAMMDLHGCSAEEAIQQMTQYETQQMNTQDFYALLQTWIGEERTLVDKTPAYALDLEILKRAEVNFENARYIHLLRHPAGMVNSFEEAKTAQVFFRYEHDFPDRELAEMTWLASHQNILKFLSTVPKSRQYRLKFEELVAQPKSVMEQVSDFLDIPCQEAMWQPYQKLESRMTDGIYDVSKMLGDVKFHTHGQIDLNIADRWQQSSQAENLSELTWQFAEKFDYHKPITPTEPTRTIKRADRSAYRHTRSASGSIIPARGDQ